MLTLRSFTRTVLQVALIIALLGGCSAGVRKARHMARGEKYFKAGEYEKAKLEFLNVMRIDAQDPAPFKRMGAIWMEQGAPLRAGPFLVRVRELAPKDADNRITLARLFITLGSLTEARKEAEIAVQLEPQNADAVRLLAEASRTPQEIAAAEQMLQKSSAKNTVSYQLAAATLALKKGDIASAEQSLQTALQIDPKSASAHTAMAAIGLMRKDVEKAGAEFKASADASPFRSVERIQYAEFKAQTGSAKEAIEMLKGITDKAPDYLPAWRLLGQIALAQKNYDEALKDLENVFKTDPDNVDSRMVQAQALVAKGDGPKAVEVLQRLEKTYPKVPAIKIQLAKADLLSNNAVDAMAALNDALAIDPSNTEAKVLLAESNLRAGDAQAVVNGLEQLVRTQTGLGEAQLLLADAYRLLGRFDDAAAIFRSQLNATPDAAPPYLGLGVILREQKKNDEARATFEKALELSPGNLIAINQLVEMDIADKAYDSALKRIHALLQTAPQSAAAYVLEGKVYSAQEQWDPAAASLAKAIELDPNFGPAYDLLVTAYLAENKLPEAAKELETLVARNPNNSAALMQLGLTYEKMEDFAKAASSYEKVVALRPDFALALNNLAYLYSEKLNQLDKGADAARKARNLQPGNPAIADTLGWILYRQGDYQQAVNLLQESASKLSNQAEVDYHFGSAAYMMGQVEVARTAFQKALESSQDFPGKDEARRRLGLIGDGSNPPAEMPVADLEALVKQYPKDVFALTRLAEAQAKQEQFAKAAVTYQQILETNSRLVSPTLKLAQLYAGPLKDPAKALELAKKARELAPTDPTVGGMIGALAFQEGNFSWAHSLLQDALRQKPDDSAILRDYAWAAYSVGKVAEARQAMERLQSVAPNAPEATGSKPFLAMTSLEEHPENLAPSESEVNAILKEQPDYAPALVAKAAIEVAKGQGGKAKETYAAVLRRFPDFAPAQKHLAQLYADEPADLAQAYDLATKARQTLPRDPDLARTLGEISYKRKEYSRAIQVLQESDRAKPLNADSLFYLGMSFFEAKQAVPARETLNRAIAAGLKQPLGDEAQKALKALEKKGEPGGNSPHA